MQIGLNLSLTLEHGGAGAPTLDMTFTGTGNALDSRITFSRNSNAMLFDSTGTLVWAPNNHIRNNTMVGAVAGTPGTLPTNWNVSGLGALTQQVVGTGTVNGVTYIDLRFSGTTSTTQLSLRCEPGGTGAIAAANGQTWAMSMWSAIVAGGLTNINSYGYGTLVYDAVGGFIGAPYSNGTINTTSTLTRTQTAGAIAIAGTAFIQPQIYFLFNSGVAIDITLRIGLPQLGLGSTATVVNATSGTAYFGPRFDYDPSTLAARGLLIEEQRANNFIWSDSFRARQLDVTVTSGTFQNGETVTATGGGAGTYIAADSTATSFAIYNLTNTSAWTGTLTGGTSGATATINAFVNVWTNNANTTITRNTQAAPDGTTTADTMAASTVGTFARTTFQDLNTSTQGAWTFSLFVKAGTLTNNLMALRLRDNTGTHAFRANFNLSTLAVPTVSIDGATWVAGTATVTSCPNGWVRISISGTVNTTISFLRGEIWLGGYQNVAETIGTAFLWGGQLEAGAFPTSYIPTTTTALTRSADVASVNTLSPWYNQTEGTVYAELQSLSPLTGAQSVALNKYPHVWQIEAGATDSNPFWYGVNAELIIGGTYNNIGAVPSGINKIAVSLAPTAGQSRSSLNGAAAVNRNGTLTGTATLFSLGKDSTNNVNNFLNGYLRRLTYYPRALSAAELQAITA